MTENKQDTITVELPIRPMLNGDVKASSMRLTRRGWREAANGGGDWSDIVRAAAPAVVAWIERDEFKPLDIPEVGRTIKATLRDGRVETFKVGRVGTGDSAWASVRKADTYAAVRYIQRTPDVDDDDPYPTDIIAWEYADEPAESEPEATHTVTVSLQADLSGFADSLQAAADAIREASK